MVCHDHTTALQYEQQSETPPISMRRKKKKNEKAFVSQVAPIKSVISCHRSDRIGTGVGPDTQGGQCFGCQFLNILMIN